MPKIFNLGILESYSLLPTDGGNYNSLTLAITHIKSNVSIDSK